MAVTADPHWRPGAQTDALRLRARLLASTRAFFSERDVLEVQTPALSRHGISTPEIDSFRVDTAAGPRFLRTSPEFAHKRLLAAGVGDLYELGPVFRDGELGGRHNPEFTLLEWYRTGVDHFTLMDEVGDLLERLLGDRVEQRETLTYAEAFDRHLGIDVFEAADEELADMARRHRVAPGRSLTRDGWLDLLFATVVAPNLASRALTFVHAYPASQAALARIDPDDWRVARRFEVFVGALELANGFHELLDADEQRLRFVDDNRRRRRQGKVEIEADEAFLAALDAGLPECAGVAVGFDRVVMLAARAEQIDEVLSFPWERA